MTLGVDLSRQNGSTHSYISMRHQNYFILINYIDFDHTIAIDTLNFTRKKKKVERQNIVAFCFEKIKYKRETSLILSFSIFFNQNKGKEREGVEGQNIVYFIFLAKKKEAIYLIKAK